MNNEELELLNAWAADKLGISVKNNGSFLVVTHASKVGIDGTCFFDLTDARCREAFWEWQLKNTGHNKLTWFDYNNGSYMLEITDRTFYGYSIQDAELAAINAIRLSEVE